MKTIAHKFFFTLLFIISLCKVYAQGNKPQTRVSGALLDEQGKPVVYATASLIRAKDSTVVKGAISNDAGVYTFDHINTGDYIIKASVIGYQLAFTKPFTVNGSTAIITIPQLKMQPKTSSLNTVTITSSKPLIEQRSDRTVVNVENSPLAAGNTAMEILERAPGVSVDKDDNISLKGKQGVTVMINDKLTYLTAAQLATLLRSTDGNTIQSIELITNPSAKYDAAGNSGIINIKLKKNKQVGTNGNLSVGGGYGHYNKNNESLTINHKEGKLNLFATISHNDNKPLTTLGLNRIITDPSATATYFNQNSDFLEIHHNNSYRVGADYDMSTKNTMGFSVSGYYNTEVDHTNNSTLIGRNFTTADSSLRTRSATNQNFKNIAINLNDVYKIDTAGQQLNIDLDYSKFDNHTNSIYHTDFFAVDGSNQHPGAYLQNLTPSVINIRSAKVDYTKPLTTTLKLEAGAKLSDVKTDNDLQESVQSNLVPTSSNHFIYDEKISAGYLNLNKNFKNTSIQAGLRAEYTNSLAHADSLSITQVVPRHYLNFFPSLFIHQKLNEKNELNLTYSRRIDRPGYDALNPFIFRLDPYTYQKGNSFLQPQYTNNYELGYTYNKKINVTLGYSKTTDVMTEVPGTNPATKVSFVTQQNLQTQNNYNINIFSPYTVAKWWEGNVNLTGFYLGFKSNNLEGQNLNTGQRAFNIRTTQTFLPIKGYKAEVTASYQSALTYALFNVKPQYSVDAGVSHSFANKKANLKLSVSDIFNTRTNNVTTNYGANNIVIYQKRDTRIARLTFTYNFGSTKLRASQHQSGADDLKSRVKGNN